MPEQRTLTTYFLGMQVKNTMDRDRQTSEVDPGQPPAQAEAPAPAVVSPGTTTPRQPPPPRRPAYSFQADLDAATAERATRASRQEQYERDMAGARAAQRNDNNGGSAGNTPSDDMDNPDFTDAYAAAPSVDEFADPRSRAPSVDMNGYFNFDATGGRTRMPSMSARRTSGSARRTSGSAYDTARRTSGDMGSSGIRVSGSNSGTGNKKSPYTIGNILRTSRTARFISAGAGGYPLKVC